MKLTDRHIFEVLLPRFEQLGIDPEKLLVEAAFPIRFLHEADGSHVDPRHLFRAACRLAKDPLLLIRTHSWAYWEAGQPVSPLGVLAAAQQTVRELLQCISRFQSCAMSGLTIELRSDSDATRVIFRSGDRVVDPLSIEYAVATLASFVVVNTGSRVDLRRLSFRHAPRCSPARYREVLGTDVSFEQAYDGFIVGPKDLNVMLERSSPLLREVLEKVLLRDQKELANSQQNGLRNRTLETIKHHLIRNETPAVASVAKALGMTQRTYQRKLQQHQLTFTQLRLQAMVDRAKELLSQQELSVTEVSSRSGFSQAGSFSRAFRRSTGLTPNQYRKAPEAAVD